VIDLRSARLAAKLRLPAALSASAALIAVQLAVGGLYPAVGHSIGKLQIPASVATLIGGADFGTVTGWFRSEIGSIYGPLLIAGIAITAASATLAGEEEEGTLGLVLSYPVSRARIVLAKAAAVAALVLIVAAATWIGMISGVVIAGGGITVGHMTALAFQLACFGLISGAVTICAAAASGRRGLTTGIGAAVAVGGWLINGFAPLVSAISWLRYISPFYYYAGHDPLTRGVWVLGALVLLVVAAVLTGLAAALIGRRDLRG
jgi:ABC-2 type transport system permease protein